MINKKEDLLNNAFDLFMQYGVRSVTMDDIAKKLGISKKTIYQYVDNKKNLIGTVIINYLEKDEQDILNISKEAESAIAEMYALAKHVNQFLMRMKPTLMYDLQKYYREEWLLIRKKHFAFIQNIIRKNIERGKTENLYRMDIDAEIISRFYTKASECATDEQIFPSTEYLKPNLFLEHLTYHLYGLVNDRGREYLNKKNLKTESNA